MQYLIINVCSSSYNSAILTILTFAHMTNIKRTVMEIMCNVHMWRKYSNKHKAWK